MFDIAAKDASQMIADQSDFLTVPDCDLGIDKPRWQTRVVVAMSGGVDSSVVAALLADQGYEVIGVTLQLYDQGQIQNKSRKSCCAGQDIYDARHSAEKIGIPHYVLNYESLFSQQVMDDFAASYVRGETPIPCVSCNQKVKFKDLLEMAQNLGADALATGHYVRWVNGKQGPELWCGQDPTKDQSYFLFATTQEQLAYLRFPLGEIDKNYTRKLAQYYGLGVAHKPDSQDICFVPNGSYADIVKKLRPDAAIPGDIIDQKGKILGRHEGIINFTIGQRRGIGIGGGEPLYVIALDAEKHHVIVGPKSALAQSRVRVKDVNLLDEELLTQQGRPIQVKLRANQEAMPANLSVKAENGGCQAEIMLHAPAFGVAPGQAAVFYDGERVLGGGWIVK